MNGVVLRLCMRLWCMWLAFGALSAQAQVFSPGPLSRAHAEVEGLQNCTKCHVEAGQHDNGRCLDCHKEIGSRQRDGAGYHARVKAQTCAECHREHRGVGAAIVEWTGGVRAFNHSLTGWPLEGAHKKNECKDCHQTRRISDDDVQALVRKSDRKTYLGLPTACVQCHFDEHRGQEGNRCDKCHTSTEWKKAPQFSHQKMSDFPLTGKHKAVKCENCHQDTVDDRTPVDAFPAPRARVYLQMKDIPHASCTACHDDVHNGSFGRNCTSCHSTEGWKVIKQTASDFGFHDKTDFPLRGEHTAVACKKCLGPFRGEAAKFKNLKHQHCSDCHMDAHVGQIKKDSKSGIACETCHEVTGFSRVIYDVVKHDETDFPLTDAHRAVACNACHTADNKLDRRVPTAVRREQDRKGRAVLVSNARLAFSKAEQRCDACHADVHHGQFSSSKRELSPVVDAAKQNGCAACHSTVAFVPSTFDHDLSRFKLEGKHQDAACGQCHAPATKGKERYVMYQPLPTECSACHTDEHVGQLERDGITDCTRCHAPTGFKPAKFDHNDPAQARFALSGAHQKVDCVKCHPAVDVDGDSIARYKPLAVTCAACHVDEHRGEFDRFVP